MWFVYVLICKDGSFYTGATNNLEKRFAEHKSGKGGRYTRSHRPVKVAYKEAFSAKSEALKKESEIKSWSREMKITNLKLVSNFDL